MNIIICLFVVFYSIILTDHKPIKYRCSIKRGNQILYNAARNIPKAERYIWHCLVCSVHIPEQPVNILMRQWVDRQSCSYTDYENSEYRSMGNLYTLIVYMLMESCIKIATSSGCIYNFYMTTISIPSLGSMQTSLTWRNLTHHCCGVGIYSSFVTNNCMSVGRKVFLRCHFDFTSLLRLT